jgi:hypothetical protein
MAEERTVSTFGWLSPALRNRIDVSTVASYTQIRQYTQHHAKRESAKSRDQNTLTKRQSKDYDNGIFRLLDGEELGDSWLDKDCNATRATTVAKLGKRNTTKNATAADLCEKYDTTEAPMTTELAVAAPMKLGDEIIVQSTPIDLSSNIIQKHLSAKSLKSTKSNLEPAMPRESLFGDTGKGDDKFAVDLDSW